jgi:hypothetical protein
LQAEGAAVLVLFDAGNVDVHRVAL